MRDLASTNDKLAYAVLGLRIPLQSGLPSYIGRVQFVCADQDLVKMRSLGERGSQTRLEPFVALRIDTTPA